MVHSLCHFSRRDPNVVNVSLPFATEAEWEDGNWHESPVHDGLFVHQSGNYVYDQQNQEHCPILVRTFLHSGWVKVQVYFRGTVRGLNKLALEAYEGTPLTADEVADHINNIRGDNSIHNLRRRHELFNANNRRPSRVSQVTGEPGVIYRNDCGGRFIAHYQVYTLDERTRYKTQSKSFMVRKYGRDEALRLAIACRRSRHLNVRG